MDFLPAQRQEIEDPEVVKIGNALASEDDEIGEEKLSRVVGSLPGSRLILYIKPKSYLSP